MHFNLTEQHIKTNAPTKFLSKIYIYDPHKWNNSYHFSYLAYILVSNKQNIIIFYL